MINTAKAVRQSIKARTGNPFSLVIAIFNEDGTAGDVSTYDPKLRVFDSGGKFLEMSLTSGITVVDNTFVFSLPAEEMNYKGNFTYTLNPGAGMNDWLDGPFQIGDYNSDQTTDNLNITLSSGIQLNIQLNSAAGSVGSVETSLSIKDKYEANTDRAPFTPSLSAKLTQLPESSELSSIFQNYDQTIETLQANIATLEGEIAILKGAPTNINLAGNTIPDGTTGGYKVGNLTVDGNPAPTFSVTDGGLAVFEIRLNSELWFTGTANRATKGSYSITIIADNGVAPNAQKGYTITVTQAAGSKATYILLDEQTVREDAVVGTVISNITSDGDPAPTYSLVNDSNGHFTVDANGDLVTAKLLSYNDIQTHYITIRATNTAGTYDQVDVPIYVSAEAVDLTANWTAFGTYNIGDAIPALTDFTSPFSIKFTAQFTSTSNGVILRIGDATAGSGVWCSGGKLRARIGGSGTTNNDTTCFLESDISVLTASNTYLLCFIPGTGLKISSFVNNNKHRYHSNGSNTNTAPAASTGAYGITGANLPPGMVNANWDTTKGTIGTATIYHNQIPSNA